MLIKFSSLLLACALILIPSAHAEDADAAEAQAQTLAESVLNAPYNADKQLSLSPPATAKVSGSTMGLKVHIVVVSGSTLNIAGAKSGLINDTSNLNESLSKLGADVRETEIIIRMLGSVLFAFDSFDLRPDAVGSLREVVEVINSYAKSAVRVEGHTDSIGSEQYNQKLSEKRAKAVADWFAANGVTASRLTVKGLGESKAIDTNETDEGRQQNRRVEIVIEK